MSVSVKCQFSSPSVSLHQGTLNPWTVPTHTELILTNMGEVPSRSIFLSGAEICLCFSKSATISTTEMETAAPETRWPRGPVLCWVTQQRQVAADIQQRCESLLQAIIFPTVSKRHSTQVQGRFKSYLRTKSHKMSDSTHSVACGGGRGPASSKISTNELYSSHLKSRVNGHKYITPWILMFPSINRTLSLEFNS